MHLIVSGNKVSNRIHTNWNFETKKGRIRVSRFTPKSKIIFGNHKNSGAYRVKINSSYVAKSAARAAILIIIQLFLPFNIPLPL
jgi:hypothetical protein